MIEEYRKIDENLKDNEIDEEIARIRSNVQDFIHRNSSKNEMRKMQTNANNIVRDEKER